MKKSIFVLLISSVLFAACSKTDNSSSYPNTITINDNGIDYTMKSTFPSSSEDNVNVTLLKTSSSSALIINAFNTSSNKQFSLNFKAYGSYTGIGHFAQSNTHNSDNQLVEYFVNGQTYNLDSTSVNVTTSNDNYIDGTFNLWLSNSKGTRMIWGAFSAHHPTIQ